MNQLDQEIEATIKKFENHPPPAWMYHYNRYEDFKEEYPLTVSEESYKIKYTTLITVELAKEFPISELNESPLEQKNNRTAFYRELDKIDKMKFETVLESYQIESPGHPYAIWSPKKTVYVERKATCMSCGTSQIIELIPLAVDRDCWECAFCHKTHAHKRPGWSEPIE